MDEDWNEYVEKKQQTCYNLMLYTFMLSTSVVMISFGLSMNIEDQTKCAARDVILGIGMIFIHACITQPQWARENKHNHRLLR